MKDLRWAFGLGRGGRSRLVAALVLGALAAASAVALSATAAWLIARASQRPPVLHLMVAIVAVRAFGLGRAVLRYGERLLGHDTTFRVLGDVRVATVDQVARVAPAGVAARGTDWSDGALLARFADDVDQLQDLWVRVLLPYGGAALVGIATTSFVAVLVPGAGLALGISLVVAAVAAPWTTTVAARGADRLVAPLRANYERELLELLDGAAELTVLGALDRRLAVLDETDAALTAAQAHSARAAGMGAAVSTLAAGAATWFALWYGVGAAETGRLGAVNLAVVALVPLAVHELFAGLRSAGQLLPSLQRAAGRLRDVFTTPVPVVDPVDPVAPPAGPLGLRVRGLTARWGSDQPAALASLSFDAPPGTVTLIVGPSGSGKSTMAAVLLRLLEPASGRVELVAADGHSTDLRALRADDARTLIGWCAQDAYVFDSTIDANLRLARPDADEAARRDALAAAGLGEWVDRLPGGLATMVGEHGRALSGGERQRLALARVLLADRPILVFDEPTEHLDPETARSLADTLLATTRGRTVLVITHQPELFPDVERRVQVG